MPLADHKVSNARAAIPAKPLQVAASPATLRVESHWEAAPSRSDRCVCPTPATTPPRPSYGVTAQCVLVQYRSYTRRT